MKAKLIRAMLAALFTIPVYAADSLKAFPPAEKGMDRFVLRLPTHDDESLMKVELLVGKTIQTDARNRYFFVGKIEKETIKGWGYTRYLRSEERRVGKE